MKKVLAIIICIIIALVAGFVGGMHYSKSLVEDYDLVTIEEEIIEVADLATFQYDYTEEGGFNGNAKKVLGYDVPFTKKAMKIRYSGTVKLGPKLKDNLQVDLDQEAKKLNVAIPHSVILSHEIDEDSLQVVYVKNGVFNAVTPDNANQLRKEMKEKKEKSVMKSDYLDQADKNAVDQLSTFLTSVYPDLDVEVSVQEQQ